MTRLAVQLCSALTGVIAIAGCSSSARPAVVKPAPAPAVDSCLHATSARRLAQATTVDCSRPHEGQVYGLISLPSGLTDPSVKAQVTAALPRLGCPAVKAWLGYAGSVPLGLLQTWRFPTKAQIAAGARWTACVVIRAPAADHDTLEPMVGSYRGKLSGAGSPLPQLGRCAPTHTNGSFIAETCRPGSTQWVWLGSRQRSAGAYPGPAKVKKSAHDACDRLIRAHGGPRAFVYYPTTAAAWAKAQQEWSCWAPLAQVTH